MGNLLGRGRVARGDPGPGFVVLGLPLLLVALVCAACADDDDDPVTDLPSSPTSAGSTEPTEADAALRPCVEDRHMVAFDILGLLTVENVEALGPWVSDNIGPTPRPGSVALVQAYRERGYEILYVNTIPDGVFPGRSVSEVMTEWLQANGYPAGEGAQVWVWDGQEGPSGQIWIAITDELLRLAGEGVSVDAAYTENVDKAYAYASGGVPEERNFTLTPVQPFQEGAPTSAPTTVVPNDDLEAHAAAVQQLPPVCQVG